MAIDYVLDPHLSSELPARARRRPQAANAVVCLSKHGVVNESVDNPAMIAESCQIRKHKTVLGDGYRPAAVRRTAVGVVLQYPRPGRKQASRLDCEKAILHSCMRVCRLPADRGLWGQLKATAPAGYALYGSAKDDESKGSHPGGASRSCLPPKCRTRQKRVCRRRDSQFAAWHRPAGHDGCCNWRIHYNHRVWKNPPPPPPPKKGRASFVGGCPPKLHPEEAKTPRQKWALPG